jgi:hypothetical protein
MGFLSFFWSSPLGIVVGVITAAGVLIVVVVVAGAALAVTGGPGPCTPGGGPITVNDATAQAFDNKWEALNNTLDNGSPATANFTESEVSSFVDRESGSTFSDVRICIHDGFGEATAEMDFIGLSAKIKVTGNVAFGEHPEAVDVDIEVGNVPSVFTNLVEGLIEDLIDEEPKKVDLDHSYSSLPTEGNGQIDGVP